MMVDEQAEVIKNKRLIDGVFLMTLKSSEISGSFLPGQFVMIGLDVAGYDPLLRRPFSIAYAEEDGTFSIIYRIVGRGTKILSESKKGKRLAIHGPLGKGFDIPDREMQFVIVSGGMGIAPLLSLAQVLSRDKRSYEFLAGYRTADDMIPVEDILPFELKIRVSTEDGSAGVKGLVSDLIISSLKNTKEPDKGLMIFSCGPMNMLKRIHEIVELYNTPCQVSVESSMACGMGACQGCVMPAARGDARYLRVCKEGPVFWSHEIDWVSIS